MRIPILCLDRILLVSIQIDLSDTDAIQLQQDILRKIVDTEALGVAIDIAYLDVVDSYMSRVLNDTVTMIRLLGAEVVICGIQPYVAMTLIEMGRNLIDAETTFNLNQGLKVLTSKIKNRADNIPSWR